MIFLSINRSSYIELSLFTIEFEIICDFIRTKLKLRYQNKVLLFKLGQEVQVQVLNFNNRTVKTLRMKR